MIDAIEKDFGRCALDAIGQLGCHLLEQLTQSGLVERAEVVRTAQNRQERGLADVFLFGGDRDDLLRRDIGASGGNLDFIEMAAADRAHRGGAFEKIVRGHREEAALGRRVEAMAGAADPLDRGGNRFRGIELADQLDRADVDAQLQRRGRNDRLQLAALEPLLGEQALLAREAAVMRHHGVGAKALLQVEGDPLGPSAGQSEDESGAMLRDQARDLVVHRLPVLMGRQRAELGAGRGHLEVHVARAIVGAHDLRGPRRADGAVGAGIETGQEAGESLDRIERCREADSRRARAAAGANQAFQPLQRDGQMRSALVAGKSMKLVNDHVANVDQLLAKARRGQQDEERLRRSDEDVRRPAEHRTALAGRRIAGAKAGAQMRQVKAHRGAADAHAFKRLVEVDADVVGESLQRGDVEDRDFVAQLAALRVEHQAVDRPHEGGKGLAAAGGRTEQNVVAGSGLRLANHGPSQFLRARGPREAALEPIADGGMETGRKHRSHFSIAIVTTAAITFEPRNPRAGLAPRAESYRNG